MWFPPCDPSSVRVLAKVCSLFSGLRWSRSTGSNFTTCSFQVNLGSLTWKHATQTLQSGFPPVCLVAVCNEIDIGDVLHFAESMKHHNQYWQCSTLFILNYSSVVHQRQHSRNNPWRHRGRHWFCHMVVHMALPQVRWLPKGGLYTVMTKCHMENVKKKPNQYKTVITVAGLSVGWSSSPASLHLTTAWWRVSGV